MGFNRRKMEAQRKAQADAEAAARRAADTPCRAPDHRLERALSPANALTVHADDWRRAREPAPLLMGLLPGLPHHAGH
jgi:hypothetical protein